MCAVLKMGHWRSHLKPEDVSLLMLVGMRGRVQLSMVSFIYACRRECHDVLAMKADNDQLLGLNSQAVCVFYIVGTVRNA